MKTEEVELETDNEVPETPPVGQVQGIKDELARKQTFAESDTPEGMELVGWYLDGFVSSYTLLDNNARPVYAFLGKIDGGTR